MARQEPRIGLADMRDAERVDEARERDRAARVDRREEILHARLAPALALFEPQLAVAALEGEDVLGRADDAFVVELIDALRAEPFDVEGVARDEMLEALARLRRADQPAGAAPQRILRAPGPGHTTPPVQRRTESSLPERGLTSRTAWLPQAGHTVGKT